nr:alpha-1,4-N-acetylglucosaminyltransferase-like isoform X1 [Pelodiscus sinensis]|eukprot:XP_025033994.1 alpha-1,4-N-acetylglucosaminyltransferase-like isoform X1 [Pelodiscus sinensis]
MIAPPSLGEAAPAGQRMSRALGSLWEGEIGRATPSQEKCCGTGLSGTEQRRFGSHSGRGAAGQSEREDRREGAAVNKPWRRGGPDALTPRLSGGRRQTRASSIREKARMMKWVKIGLGITCVFFLAFVYKRSQPSGCIYPCQPCAELFPMQKDDVSQSSGIIFVETTDRLEPPPLVSCSVESAARAYPNRPVRFFMKGLKNNTSMDSVSTSPAFALLSAMKNVFLLPLDMETVFQDTPLLPWYHKVNPAQERYWLHVSADGIRLALIWKNGGIYMDTDVISIRPISLEDFLTAEDFRLAGNAIFGFSRHHKFIWDCMKDFVQNYRGDIWGHQGPGLLTRRLKALCPVTNFHKVEDINCLNISYLHPQRYYPIPYVQWNRYFQVWEKSVDFNNSYSLHLWNYMNRQHKRVVAGSNTLVENLFKTYCPTTYKVLIQGPEGSSP